MNRNIAGKICLLLCSIVFGLSYVFMNEISQYIEPFSTNTIRFTVGAICLFPFIFKKDTIALKEYVKTGFSVGALLVFASYCQQLATLYSSPGKIGFIVSLYIVFVPIINLIFFKRKINILQALSIVIAIIGLVVLCDIKDFSFKPGDILSIITSIIYAAQILYIDRKADYLDPIKFTFSEFVGTATFSLIGSLLLESFSFSSIQYCIRPLAYISVIACGLGYTLQVFGQRYTDNTIASMIMSLESVFSVIGAFLIQGTMLSIKELIGCAIMFVGVILCIKFNKNVK